MAYRFRKGMSDITNPDLSTWDKTDWAFAGLIGFALFTAWSAFKSATRRLK
jgi:hypothetical protein